MIDLHVVQQQINCASLGDSALSVLWILNQVILAMHADTRENPLTGAKARLANSRRQGPSDEDQRTIKWFEQHDGRSWFKFAKSLPGALEKHSHHATKPAVRSCESQSKGDFIRGLQLTWGNK
jgi:hypothetical protein